MLVGVFGTSTPLGHWGFWAVRHVVQTLYGDHHQIHCLGIEDLRRSWAARGEKSVVVTSDCPDAEIAELFANSGAPLIAFLDDPEDAVAFSLEARAFNVQQALSFSTHCFCALNEILASPNVTCFLSRHLDDDVRDVFARILQVITGSVVQEQLEDIMQRVIFDYRPGQLTKVSDLVEAYWLNGALPRAAFCKQPLGVQNLINVTCKAYRPIFDCKQLTNLEWPRDLFFTSNERNDAPELINLAGPARCIIWGPYLHLPKGNWTARVDFELSDNVSRNEIEADIYDGQDVLVVAHTELPTAGVFSFELQFLIRGPHQQMQLRISLLKGAIEGRFGLRRVSLRRTEPTDATKLL